MRRLGRLWEGGAYVRAEEIQEQQEGKHAGDDREGTKSRDEVPNNGPDQLQREREDARGPGPALQPEGANAEGEEQDAQDGIPYRRVGKGPRAVAGSRSTHTGGYQTYPDQSQECQEQIEDAIDDGDDRDDGDTNRSLHGVLL